MKQLVLMILVLLLIASPVVADDHDELYHKWYAGDWVSKAEDIGGQQVIFGLRIAQSNDILGCVVYPDNDGINRKFFGQIIDTGAKHLEIRLSNGKEIELTKVGKEPNNKLKLIKKIQGNRTEAEFQKEFLPTNCM